MRVPGRLGVCFHLPSCPGSGVGVGVGRAQPESSINKTQTVCVCPTPARTRGFGCEGATRHAFVVGPGSLATALAHTRI